jgi:ABC-2 type transport system permease protein
MGEIMSGIFVMWKRQIIRYWRSRGRMLGSLGQPILFFLALGFGFGPIYAKAGGGNYLEFLVPGILAMTILFTSVFSGIEVIWDRQFGFLKETLVAPVPRWQIMLGKTLGGATVALFQALLIFILAFLFGFRPSSILLIIPAFLFMFLIGFLFSAFGVAIASNLEDMRAFPFIMNFILMPIFFLSGALFPLDSLPKSVVTVTLFNPLSYGVEGLRAILTGTGHISLLTSLIVLLIISAIIFAIGTYFFSKVEA